MTPSGFGFDTEAFNNRQLIRQTQANAMYQQNKVLDRIDNNIAGFQEGVDDALTSARDRFDRIQSQLDNDFNNPFPVSIEDFQKPFTDAYNKLGATYQNQLLLRTQDNLDRVEAYEAGSKDARPGAKAQLVDNAKRAIGQQYSQDMLALKDAQAGNLFRGLQTYSQLSTDYDIKQKQLRMSGETALLQAETNLVGTIASFTAQMAGVQASVYSAELGAASQIASSTIQAGAQLATTSMRINAEKDMMQLQRDWAVEDSNATLNYWDQEIMSAIDDTYMSFLNNGLTSTIV